MKQLRTQQVVRERENQIPDIIYEWNIWYAYISTQSR